MTLIRQKIWLSGHKIIGRLDIMRERFQSCKNLNFRSNKGTLARIHWFAGGAP